MQLKNLGVLLFISLFSIGLTAQNTAKFSGKIINPAGEKVFISKIGTKEMVYLDSAIIDNNGEFKMHANIDSITIVIFSDGNELTQLVLKPNDDIYLSLNTTLFDETIIYSGKGSERNNALNNLSLIQENINENISALSQIADTTEIYAYIDKAYKEYIDVAEGYQKTYTEIDNYLSHYIKDAKTSINKIKSSVRANIAFNKLVKELKGTEGINIEGLNLNGEEKDLSEFKGKITVIDFWATWCGPCKAEIPSFIELEKEYGKSINFVSIGVWCKQEDWQKMAADYGLKNNLFIAKDKIDQLKPYNVRSIPRYIILDENFKILDANAPRPSSGKMTEFFK